MNGHPLLKNKLYLYMTEFFSGVAVMAVELGASRLLAPYFSSSQIVWTIIIGTIMIAMALGNIWGGRIADKDPNPDRLYMRLIVAAIWIGCIPLVGKYVIIGISGLLVLAVDTNFLIIAAFASCMVIFVYPLFLLGTVTPSLVKYAMESMEDSGRTVGRLEAFNTVGSILGTFLPTFVTIPAVGTSATFLIFSAVLLLLGLLYFLTAKRRRTTCAVVTGVYVLCCVFGHADSFAFWEKNLLYEGESIYNYLQVKETNNSVLLSTNVLFGVQSVAMKDGGLTGMYYDTALAAPVMAGVDDPDILVLGMGSGTFATLCAKYFPESTVTGVEIDGQITNLAHEYFGLPDSVEVATYDGRAYLAVDDNRYDVIMVDAYQDITIPFQMSSVEFFTLVRDHLKPGGVMVVNLNMHNSEEASINEYLCDTIASVFDHVQTADVPGTTNRELFAAVEPLPDLAQALTNVSDWELTGTLSRVADRLMPYEGGEMILTDDKAPVELLGMRMIDSLIEGEIGYYKGIFEREGLDGLLGELMG
ncbi:MAG: fused MFS/spermidine synthase [Clostridia bacterium]|nr:fused MFS/spermidine synthase [Clostridia bacterium]